MNAPVLWCRSCGAVWLSSVTPTLSAEAGGCLRCDGPLVRVVESQETLNRRRLADPDSVGPSQEIQLADRAVDVLRGGDRGSVLEHPHPPGFLLELPRGFLARETYSGHQGLRSAFRDLDEGWIDFHVEVHTLREVDDGVVAEGAASGRRRDGQRGEWPAVFHFELEEGELQRVTLLLGTEAAGAGDDQLLRT